MNQTYRPSDNSDRYMNDPSFIEERFGLKSLAQLLGDGVLGVARLIAKPSFRGESVYTLIYRAEEITLQSAVAKHSLWYSLSKGPWVQPNQSEERLPSSSLPSPLKQWRTLKEAARAAPSVKIAVIDGENYFCLDGVSYHHRVYDDQTSFDAEWSNPDPRASNHVRQLALLNAYKMILKDLCSLDEEA